MGLRLTRGAGLPAGRPFDGSVDGRGGGAAPNAAPRWPPPAGALLVVHENFNAGWQASLAGHRLTAVRVDGWEQAFLVPANSSGTVTLVYAPDRPFKAGLLAGLLAVLALLLAGARRRPAGAELAGAPAARRRAGGVRRRRRAAGAGHAAGRRGRPGQRRCWLLALWRPGPASRAGCRCRPALAVAAAGVLNAAGPSVSARPLTDAWLTQELVLLALLSGRRSRPSARPSGSGAER